MTRTHRQAPSPHQIKCLACMSEPMTAHDISAMVDQSTSSVIRSLCRLASRGLVCKAGKVPSATKPRTLWRRTESGEAIIVTTADALDVVDWMADAVLRGDTRTAHAYADDLGITRDEAEQRIAEATRRGWLDWALYPTDAGLAARDASTRRAS